MTRVVAVALDAERFSLVGRFVSDVAWPRLVFVATSGLLLAAAGLKAHQLAHEPTTGSGIFASRGFLIGVVQAELFLGLWLLNGFAQRAAWHAAVICFAAFAAVSLEKVISGEATCGCFGRLQISPWSSLLMDAAVVAALVSVRKAAAERPDLGPRTKQLQALVTLGGFVVLAAASVLYMAQFSAAQLDLDGSVVGGSDVVILEPQEWIGSEFPLLSHVDVGPELRRGSWIVVLFRHDCSKCQAAMPYYERLAASLVESGGLTRLALIELPPYGPQSLGISGALRGRLSVHKEWFVTVPTYINLREGFVQHVAEQAPQDVERSWGDTPQTPRVESRPAGGIAGTRERGKSAGSPTFWRMWLRLNADTSKWRRHGTQGV